MTVIVLIIYYFGITSYRERQRCQEDGNSSLSSLAPFNSPSVIFDSDGTDLESVMRLKDWCELQITPYAAKHLTRSKEHGSRG